MRPTIIHSIGHSNHSSDEFLALLAEHRIEALVDVRRYPTSRRLPHFGRQTLAAALEERGIAYHWLEGLGGHREEGLQQQSPNHGLRNESFRNYADYMLTEPFAKAVEQLLQIAQARSTAFMCAEAAYTHCHRRLLCDYLTVSSFEIRHILPDGSLVAHELTPTASTRETRLTYPEILPLFD